MNDGFAMSNLLDGTSGASVFIKYWNKFSISFNWILSPLPGRNERVSGSSIGGTAVGINKYISNAHKKAATQIVEFITSKEIQKKILLPNRDLSGMDSFYDDPDVCAVYNCELIKKIQPIGRPTKLTNNYVTYSEKYIKYFFDYFYGNGDFVELLKKLKDLSFYYYITIDQSSSSIEFIIFIITSTLSIIILMSGSVLFLKKSKNSFSFTKIDSWLWMTAGLLSTLGYIYMEYGEVKIYKYILQQLFLNNGFTLTFIPILYQLISNIPLDYPLVNKIRKNTNKYVMLSLFILYDIILSALLFTPNTIVIKKIEIENQNKFKKCRLANILGSIIFFFFYLEKGLIFLVTLAFIFLEWNIHRTQNDMKIITTFVLSGILLYILFGIFYNNFDNYILNFLIPSIIILLYVVSSYSLLYFFKILLMLFSTENDDEMQYVIKPVDVNISTLNISTDQTIKQEENISNTVFSLILAFHNYTGEDNSSIIFRSNSIKTNSTNIRNNNSSNDEVGSKLKTHSIN